MDEVIRRIVSGIRRPFNPVPVPTGKEIRRLAEREGIAVQKALKSRRK